MRKQTHTYLNLLDVTLGSFDSEETEHKLKNNPELSFDEMFESGEFSIDEHTHLVQ